VCAGRRTRRRPRHTAVCIGGAPDQHLERAVRIGIVVLIVSLALIALAAARRTELPPWKRVGLVVAMAGLGAAVVAIKTLAH
jgi:hypothetical protein